MGRPHQVLEAQLPDDELLVIGKGLYVTNDVIVQVAGLAGDPERLPMNVDPCLALPTGEIKGSSHCTQQCQVYYFQLPDTSSVIAVSQSVMFEKIN